MTLLFVIPWLVAWWCLLYITGALICIYYYKATGPKHLYTVMILLIVSVTIGWNIGKILCLLGI